MCVRILIEKMPEAADGSFVFVEVPEGDEPDCNGKLGRLKGWGPCIRVQKGVRLGI